MLVSDDGTFTPLVISKRTVDLSAASYFESTPCPFTFDKANWFNLQISDRLFILTLNCNSANILLFGSKLCT